MSDTTHAHDLRLRPWQSDFLHVFQNDLEQGKPSFLLEATPGAGKTTAALVAYMHVYRKQFPRRSNRFVIVVPTRELKFQWAENAARFGVKVDPYYTTGRRLPHGYSGVVLTYQQVANSRDWFHRFSNGGFVILDEVHHAGDSLEWGEAARHAFERAAFVLCLSGTPFRTDNNPIPFVAYADEQSKPDYQYTYGQAIRDGVCRPVVFNLYGGTVNYQLQKGGQIEDVTYELRESHSTQQQAQKLRVAVDPESGWALPVLEDADQLLAHLRDKNPQAAGLIVCNNQSNARVMAQIVSGISGEEAVLVLSEERESSERIRTFTHSRQRWVVACNMVSEGIDIPRLQVGVYLSTTSTKMYFRQFLGRFVRATGGSGQRQIAYCFMPADWRLKLMAQRCEEVTRHFVPELAGEDLLTEREPRDAESLSLTSLFTGSSQNSGVHSLVVNGSDHSGMLVQLGLFGETGKTVQLAQAAEKLLIVEDDPTSYVEDRQNMIREIRRLVGLYVHETARDFNQVYGMLNRKQRVESQADCSDEQLAERVEILRGWLR